MAVKKATVKAKAKTVKQPETKPAVTSRTIKLNMIMGALQSINGGLALFQPVLSPQHFAILTVVIGAIHAAGGVYMRYQTKTGISTNT